MPQCNLQTPHDVYIYVGKGSAAGIACDELLQVHLHRMHACFMPLAASLYQQLIKERNSIFLGLSSAIHGQVSIHILLVRLRLCYVVRADAVHS